MADSIQLKRLSVELPAEIMGWKKSESSIFYNPENLFEYIDGGAELFLSYNFKQMLAQKYEKEGYPEITLDIFDMGNSASAFGVFSHGRETLDQLLEDGVESEYSGGLLTFWKGRFYSSIMAYPETPEKKKLVLYLGKKIAQLIPEKGEKPGIIKKLPQENLVNESVRYFFHYIWLNSHFFISNENILHINKETEVVLGRYKLKSDSDNDYFILLVSYPNHSLAKAAYHNFIDHYLPHVKGGVMQLENGRWSGCKNHNEFILVVLNASSNDLIKDILNKFGGKND